MHRDTKVQKYLRRSYGQNTQLLGIEPLREGVHGAAYRVKFTTPHEERTFIMKALFPSRFGHDHYSDRAQVLLLANANYNDMPKHIKAVDVVGESPDRLISVKNAKEFYIFMEEAGGESYFKDLDAILKRGVLNELDMERAGMFAHFLADKAVRTKSFIAQHISELEDKKRMSLLLGKGFKIIICVPLISFPETHHLWWWTRKGSTDPARNAPRARQWTLTF